MVFVSTQWHRPTLARCAKDILIKPIVTITDQRVLKPSIVVMFHFQVVNQIFDRSSFQRPVNGPESVRQECHSSSELKLASARRVASERHGIAKFCHF